MQGNNGNEDKEILEGNWLFDGWDLIGQQKQSLAAWIGSKEQPFKKLSEMQRV